MRMSPVDILVLCALLGGASTGATACSAPGPHTNRELIQDAEAIVLARVVGGTPEHFENASETSMEMTEFHDRRGPGPQVTFEILRTLKGRVARDRLNLVGSLNYFGANLKPVPYQLARPGAQRGMCFAYDYKLGSTFLLFLRNGNPYWSAVRPTNEEVKGVRDPWLLWVTSKLKRPAAGH